MDVDGQNPFINIQDDQPKPIQRSRRTYGSKPKVVNEHENSESISDNLSSSTFPVSSHQGLSESTSLPSHSLRLGEWRQKMKEIDQAESEEDETSDQRRSRLGKTHESEVQSTGSSPPSYLSELQDEPGSPSQQTHPKLMSENAGRQHSANTSFNSGSSAAISTPSPIGEQLKTRPKLSLYGSRPLPPPHRDSNLTDEEEDEEEPLSPLRAILGRSEASSRSPKISGARSTTPNRALPTSPFRSPLKSFTDATRRERKFVQKDSDEEMDDHRDLTKDLELKSQQEDELGWVTDGSVG
ncbi:3533_t:CDS:2, partial [Acaulospora colombiana]